MVDDKKKKTPEPAPIPYEKNQAVVPLCCCITVVNDHQSYAICDFLYAQDAAIACIMHARGTASSQFYEVMGLDEAKKQVIIAVMRKDKWPAYKAELTERFKVSPYAKGISYIIPINSVAGVSIYKMLANIQTIDKPIKPKKSLIGGITK
jgi:hypothetical protein